MKRKVIFSALSIIIIAVAFGAGTMAWFTAKAEAPENEFIAGTVMIEASGGGGMLYGIGVADESANTNTGNIYAIDPLAQEEILIYQNPNSYSPWWYPNGLAYDRKNHRLYFTSNQNTLFFYDFSSFDDSSALVNADPNGLFTNTNNVLGATFGGGYYWYVLNQSGKLYQVSFDGDGLVESVTERIMTTEYSLGMGDIVIDYKDGIIYGSSGTGAAGTDRIFFTYNIFTDDFDSYPDPDIRALQIAWGSDGVLYGHQVDDNSWSTVDPSDGTITPLGFTGEYRYEDLASNWQGNWNPGDCDRVYYRITSTGSKDIRLRMKLEGQWEFDQEWVDQNWEALCFSGEEKPGEQAAWESFFAALTDPVDFGFCDGNNDWELKDDGYFYYVGDLDPIKPGDEVEICLMVCLSGPDATNHFQGATYSLKGYFEAIQASNGAPLAEWVVDLYQVAP